MDAFSRQFLRFCNLGRGHFFFNIVLDFDRIFVTIRSGDIEPHVGMDVILWHTFPFIVHYPQTKLGFDIPLFGRESDPLHRCLIILWHTFSFIIHHTKIVLGICISLLSREFEPLHLRLIVLWHTLSFFMHRA